MACWAKMGNRQSRVTKGLLVIYILTPVRDPPSFVVAAVKAV